MLRLESIAAFSAIAEAGSITNAARRLALSKSVVSERLTELERVVGTTLVRRTTRSLSLTDDGKTFHERAKQILRDVEHAASELTERRGTLTGPLRISAPVSLEPCTSGRHCSVFSRGILELSSRWNSMTDS
jgi:molybdate transport repressor ModE-like protein